MGGEGRSSRVFWIGIAILALCLFVIWAVFYQAP